jgi:hypothetical protein
MSEKFISNRQCHFGFIKQSFTKGTIFEKFDDYFVVNGAKYTNLQDFDIAKKANIITPFNDPESKKIQKEVKKAQEKEKKEREKREKERPKMEIIKSDVDEHEPIPIPHVKHDETDDEKKKNINMEVVREDDVEEIRGMKVIRHATVNEITEESQGEVVASIGKSNVDKKEEKKVATKTAADKEKSAKKAKENAEKRKKDALKKREAMKKEKK